MLEKLLAAIIDLTAALNANTAARTGGTEPAKPAAPAKTPAPAEKVKAATAKPTAAQNQAAAAAPVEKTVTQADIQAAGADLTKLADIVGEDGTQIGRSAAVAILGEFGVAKMTAAKPDQIPAIHARVKAKLAELSGGDSTSLV